MGKGSGAKSWRLSFRKQSVSVGDKVAPVRRRERGARLPGNARERMLSETGCGSSYTSTLACGGSVVFWTVRIQVFTDFSLFDTFGITGTYHSALVRKGVWRQERGTGGACLPARAADAASTISVRPERAPKKHPQCDWFPNNTAAALDEHCQ